MHDPVGEAAEAFSAHLEACRLRSSGAASAGRQSASGTSCATCFGGWPEAALCHEELPLEL